MTRVNFGLILASMSVDARVRVRYAETDQMGVVYHSNYLIWMEVGRVEYCRAAGIRYRDLEANDGIRMAVVEARCRYIAPARYDDEIDVETSIAQSNPRMVRFAYEIRLAGTQQVLAEGETKHIFLSTEMRPTKLPAKHFDLFGLSREL